MVTATVADDAAAVDEDDDDDMVDEADAVDDAGGY